MKLNDQGQILIDVSEAKSGISSMKAAIHYIRKNNNQPLGGLSDENQYDATTEESMLFLAADKLGLDLGGKAGRINVTDYA